MNGKQYNLLTLIKTQSRINIPYYQRNYNWTKSQCQNLFEDLKSLNEDTPTHFFGAVVVKSSELNSIDVIDGQQRITTVSLMLLAIYNYIKNNEIQTTQNMDTFRSNYLEDNEIVGSESIKLNSNPKDKAAYKALYDNDNDLVESSNITKNYKFFYNELEKGSINVDDLITAIKKLEIVLIELNSDDDAQLIFESINSTGLALSESDKIRNYLLMNENNHRQNELYDKYWIVMEENSNFNLDSFFKDYLTVKLSSSPSAKTLYEKFKAYTKEDLADKDTKSKNQLFEDLLDYSKAYRKYNNSDTEINSIDEVLERLNLLDFSTARVFMMPVLVDYKNGDLSDADLVETLNVIETYLARRMITKQPSNGLKFMAENLYRDTKKYYEDNKDNYSFAEVLAAVLLSKDNTGRMPRDVEFKNALRGYDFYNIKTNYQNYIFERLENYNEKEVIDFGKGFEDNKYSIEHIMPQTLKEAWKKELGDDYKRIHDTYLHNIGNLTVTGYNSEYSNRPFLEKKEMEHGFKDSPFRFLNKIPASVDTWNEEMIKNRQNQIVDKALQIWKMPQTDLVVDKNREELIDYDGGYSQFSSIKLKGYSFLDDNFVATKSWLDLYLDVINKLYEENPNPISEASLTEEKHNRLASMFRNTEVPGYSTKIDEEIHVMSNLSNADKFLIINDLLAAYNYPYDSLKVAIVGNKKEDE